jgi:predicted dehydrogenase
MRYRVIQVGTGGWGASWCSRFLPPNIEDGHIEVVAAVDKNPEVLSNARAHLGLCADECHTDLRKALSENEADFVTVVVPPDSHEAVICTALEYGLHILSEKPIADTMEASVRILKKVTAAGRKMAVTMSHRFDQDKTTFREILKSGRLGRLDYVVTRFTCAFRKYGSWGAPFRHEMPDPLMVEGAIHHLDILRSFARSDCVRIYARTWNAPWGEYRGDSNGLVLMDMANGAKCFYEGAKTNAAALNGWANEYFRAECEEGTLVLDRRQITLLREGREPEPIALLEQPKWTNAWLIEKFCEWLDGGEPMETRVEDNIQASALIFAAIESSRTGQPVAVQDFLARYL